MPGKDSAILYGLRILAVDDEPDAREMKVILEQYGADIKTAATAKSYGKRLVEMGMNESQVRIDRIRTRTCADLRGSATSDKPHAK